MSTWVDLGDLYVKKAGDEVSGSILMANNNLSVAYNSDTIYNVGTEIKSLRDSVSSINKVKSGIYREKDSYNITYYCSNHIGIAIVEIVVPAGAKNYTSTALHKVPEGYAPTEGEWYCSGYFNNSIANCRIYINNSREICYQLLGGTIISTSETHDMLHGTLVWRYA